MTFRDAFRHRLRTERKSAGLTQEEVAIALGVSVEAYGRLERGEIGDWVDYLGEIAAVIGTTPASLCSSYSGEGKKADRHLELRIQLKDAAEDLTEEDILSLLDQIRATVKRRSRR